jgi:hypothetical protein
MTTTPTLAEIAAAIADLETMDDAARAAAARRLARSVPQHLAAIGDASVYALTRTDTQPSVAARLGVSKSWVENAITRHVARSRSVS